jgi:hypothetical protein
MPSSSRLALMWSPREISILGYFEGFGLFAVKMRGPVVWQ